MRRVTVLAALACALAPASAGAAPRKAAASLAYVRRDGAARCPDETTFRGEVAALLGYDPFAEGDDGGVPTQARARVELAAAPRGAGLVARLTLTNADGGAGERTLDSPSADCTELASALAVAVAMGVDPERFAAPPAAPPVADPPAPAPAPPPAPTPVDTAAPPPSTLHPFGAVGAHVALGSAPSTTLGARIAIGLAFGATPSEQWRRPVLAAGAGATTVALEGRLDAPASLEAADGGRVTTALLAGGLALCHERRLVVCALGSVGALRGSGEGVSVTLKTSEPWAAVGARAGVGVPLGDLARAELAADVLAPLTRITLQLDGRDVWTTPAVSFLPHLALRGTF